MSLISNKMLVADAIDTVLGARDLAAIDRFFAPGYIQHSATGAEGPGALRELLAGMPAGFRYERVRILGDGDLVACHGVYYGAEEWPLAGFDVFRIADGKLAEHWDNHQRLTGPSMIGGPAEVTQPGQTETTRAIVNAFVDDVLVAGHGKTGAGKTGADVTEAGVTEAGKTEAGIVEHSLDWTGRGYQQRHFTVAEGEFALTGCSAGENVCYDLFRVDGGRIAEHWAVIMPVPAVIRHGNGLF